MKLYLFFWLLVACLAARAEEHTPDSSRLSVTAIGQEVADTFIGAVWTRVAGSEFVGGVADVYLNKQDRFPVVETAYGAVRGMGSMTSRDKTPYSAFMGIPFAMPPLGPLRFKAPREPEPWQGTRDGTYERPTCLTFREPNKGREDCLYLNVFTPFEFLDNVPDLKAVMVFIYGGAFMGGSSNTSGYGPDFLIDRDLVLVTFNYRIGPLGFLSLQNEEVPGNAGLKDQVMALRWVKQNIRSFGGDPDRVTIFGESAGAASVSYMVLSPLAAGLFNRAIMESGEALAGWAYTEPKTALEKAYLLGRRTGCTIPSLLNMEYQLYECLRDAPASLLVRTQITGLSVEELFALRPLAFVPTAEPDLPGALLTKSPMEYLTAGEFNKVPVVMGINTAEGLLLYPVARRLSMLGPGVAMGALGQDLTKLLPQDLQGYQQQRTAINQRMHEYYSPGNGALTILQFLQVISDTQFLVPMLRTAELLAPHSDQPIYLYVFSYDGPYTCYKTDTEMRALNGTSHMDELGYLFNLGPMKKSYDHSDRSKPEEQTIDIMTRLWKQFAETGQPAGPETWKPISKEGANYCDIGITAVNRKDMQESTVTFWNEIYELTTGEPRLFHSNYNH